LNDGENREENAREVESNLHDVVKKIRHISKTEGESPNKEEKLTSKSSVGLRKRQTPNPKSKLRHSKAKSSLFQTSVKNILSKLNSLECQETDEDILRMNAASIIQGYWRYHRGKSNQKPSPKWNYINLIEDLLPNGLHFLPLLNSVIGTDFRETVRSNMLSAEERNLIIVALLTRLVKIFEKTCEHLLIVVEDIHWCDSASMELISSILKSIGEIIVVVTYRNSSDKSEGNDTKDIFILQFL
jgi:hypothetical protein